MTSESSTTRDPCGDGLHGPNHVSIPFIFVDRVKLLLAMLHIITVNNRWRLGELLHVPPTKVFVMQQLIANRFDMKLIRNWLVARNHNNQKIRPIVVSNISRDRRGRCGFRRWLFRWFSIFREDNFCSLYDLRWRPEDRLEQQCPCATLDDAMSTR